MAWAPDYITVAQLKAYLRISDTDDDTELAVATAAASRAIDDHCNRQFGQVAAPEERLYTAWPDYDRGMWVATIDDLMTSTGLVVEVDGTTLTGYTLEPANGPARGRPWTRLAVARDASVQPTGASDEIAVTASWGWTAVPPAVTLAARLQASRFHARRDSPYGIAGSPDAGSEMRLLDRVDPDVRVMLRPYTRRWGAV